MVVEPGGRVNGGPADPGPPATPGSMRIVIDARTLELEHSGVGTYVHQLVHALSRLGGREEYRLLIHRPELLDWESLPRFSAWPTRFSHESHPWGDLWENLWLPRKLEREGIDLFHGPAFRIPLLPVKPPLVLTIHDLVAFRHPRTIPRRYGYYMRRVTKWAARRARRIIAVSEAARQDIINVLGVRPEVVHTIPLGVGEEFVPREKDPEKDRALLRERYGIGTTYVLFVGNLEPRKNIPVLIRAFERVTCGFGKPLQLVLCGRWGWLCQRIAQALAGSPVRDRIVLTGYAPREDLPALYRGAEVLVLPSVSEGFGLPVVESMSCGTPVVASRAAAIPEVVGEAGILVPPGEEEALAEALLTVLHDRDRAEELRRRGLLRAQDFSWREVARRTLAVYHQAARA